MEKQSKTPFFQHPWLVASISLVLVLTIIGLPVLGLTSANAAVAPSTSIVTVVPDTEVTIKTFNFPANQTFTVRMGEFGTLGVGGVVVDTQDSAAGGSFTATYTIPPSLQGDAKIAIRLQSPEGYYAYDWFENKAGGSGSGVVVPASGIPSSNITAVVKGSTVTIKVSNFPKNDTAKVRIGKIGTFGVGGTVVDAAYDTGSTGTFTETFTIPAALAGDAKLAIRIESNNTPYYLYDWFNNATTGNTATPAASDTPGPSPTPTNTPVPSATVTPGGPTATPTATATAASGASVPASGFPSSVITAVDEGNTVTIKVLNFTSNDTAKVRMGKFGTLGVGGTVVDAAYDVGPNGTFTATFTIPAALANNTKIAIRLESNNSPYYVYNWFWNNDHP